MKKERKVWAFFIVLGWLAPDLQAQQDTLRTLKLDTVVITATKYPKNKSETGKVLTIIDRDQLERSAGKDLSQILNEQVGLVVNGANSNSGKDKSVYLQGAKNEYTLVMVDGIPVSDPSGVTGGAFDLRLLSVDQVERIEILKGSQSTLYGSDAIAGVINIITKSENEKPVEANTSISLGTYNTLRATAGLQGQLKSISYNAGYSRFSTDGISEAKETGSTPFDKDGSQLETFHGQLAITPNRDFSIKPFFRFNRFEGDYDAGAYTDDTTSSYQGDLLNTGLVAQYRFDKGFLYANYSYSETNRLYEGTYGRTAYTGKFNHSEIFGNYNITKNLLVMMGIAFQDYKLMEQTAIEADPSVTITSPYATITGTWNNLSLEVGGRFNHHTKFGGNAIYSLNPYYRMGKTKLFINLSTGFKAPSLYQLFGLYGANPNLKPERSQSFEMGASGLLDKQVAWRSVFFTRRIEDVIVYQYPSNLNLDRQDDYGFEAEVSFMPGERFTIKAFYAFVTGAVTTRNASGDTTYYNLIRRPRHSASANASYQITSRVHVSANLQLVGLRDDLYFDMNTFTNQPATLQSFSLVDLYVEYKASRFIKAFVEGRNLLNTSYEEVYGYNTLGITVIGGVKLSF